MTKPKHPAPKRPTPKKAKSDCEELLEHAQSTQLVLAGAIAELKLERDVLRTRVTELERELVRYKEAVTDKLHFDAKSVRTPEEAMRLRTDAAEKRVGELEAKLSKGETIGPLSTTMVLARAEARVKQLEDVLLQLIIDAKRVLDVYPQNYRGTYFDDLKRSTAAARAALAAVPVAGEPGPKHHFRKDGSFCPYFAGTTKSSTIATGRGRPSAQRKRPLCLAARVLARAPPFAHAPSPPQHQQRS